jgi:hypothetical protein
VVSFCKKGLLDRLEDLFKTYQLENMMILDNWDAEVRKAPFALTTWPIQRKKADESLQRLLTSISLLSIS